MNKWSEENLKKIKEDFVKDLDKKYRAGYKEHEGDLRDMSYEQALQEALNEVIDLYVYLKKLEERSKND